MTSSPIRVGLIGIGARLRHIAKSVLDHANGRSIRIVAAYDPDSCSHQVFREMLGYDYEIADSEEAIVNNADLDWVFIGSWNCHHARQSILALDAGKHVFCEKPLATTLDDCLAIREAVKRSKKTFFFGLVLRYSSHYQKIREILNSGAIGQIVSFEFNETLAFNHGGYIFGNWRRNSDFAGSHMLEKCCHDLDLANWLTGFLPVKVASFGANDFFKPANRFHVERIGPSESGAQAYRSWSDPHREDPFDGKSNLLDNQVAIIQYANGARGTFHTNCNSAIPERRFYICGTEGALRADLASNSLECRRIGWETKSELFDTGQKDMHGGGDAVMAEALVRTMFLGEPPLASVEEGIASAVVAFGIDSAIQTGNTVDLGRLWDEVGIEASLKH